MLPLYSFRRTVMPANRPSLQRLPGPHSHALPSQCPYCGQPIPVDQADEIRCRIDAKEREHAGKLTADIKRLLALEKAQGDAAVQERIAALEAANAALQAAMDERIAAAE